MSAEVLRRAAIRMRADHPPDHKRYEMWQAMANWLDAQADTYGAARFRAYDDALNDAALKVATTYLDGP